MIPCSGQSRLPSSFPCVQQRFKIMLRSTIERRFAANLLDGRVTRSHEAVAQNVARVFGRDQRISTQSADKVQEPFAGLLRWKPDPVPVPAAMFQARSQITSICESSPAFFIQSSMRI